MTSLSSISGYDALLDERAGGGRGNNKGKNGKQALSSQYGRTKAGQRKRARFFSQPCVARVRFLDTYRARFSWPLGQRLCSNGAARFLHSLDGHPFGLVDLPPPFWRVDAVFSLPPSEAETRSSLVGRGLNLVSESGCELLQHTLHSRQKAASPEKSALESRNQSKWALTAHHAGV